MLTYDIKKTPGVPMYEALYRCIRDDILSGRLPAGEKLPSKRTLSTNLKVSRITVESAYNQLIAEGFVRSRERIGCFVEAVERIAPSVCLQVPADEDGGDLLDLTGNSSEKFPFSVWSRLQREVMLDVGGKLLLRQDRQGLPELRQAIAGHLAQFRAMQVDPQCIVIGAGTDFLYNLLIQLLGRDKLYAAEDPGYEKIRRIYAVGGARCVSVPMDGQGVIPSALQKAQVLHISPSHHFPTGIVTPLSRRQALLAWVREKKDRYIIEDDFDSEFRFAAHPLPAMQSLDSAGRVIYMNSFSMSIAPSIRISYMVLPHELMAHYRTKLGFYECTVPSFEQYTLARFIARGYFEKHINRMRKFYKLRRDRILAMLAASPFAEKIRILEENAGLHFLIRVDTHLSDEELAARCADAGIRIRSLASYYHGAVPPEAKGCLLLNYSGIREEELPRLAECMQKM